MEQAGYGGLVLLLACIGIHGLISYGVARRTAEMGVRMALGGSPGSVVRPVLREGLILVLLGIAAGIPMALAAAGFVKGLLFGSPTDPTILAGAALSCWRRGHSRVSSGPASLTRRLPSLLQLASAVFANGRKTPAEFHSTSGFS